jgi:hypothetical protein
MGTVDAAPVTPDGSPQHRHHQRATPAGHCGLRSRSLSSELVGLERVAPVHPSPRERSATYPVARMLEGSDISTSRSVLRSICSAANERGRRVRTFECMTDTNSRDHAAEGTADASTERPFFEFVKSEPGRRYVDAFERGSNADELYPLLLDEWRLVLDLPDPDYVAVCLAVWAANHHSEQSEPAWLMIVAPPSSGKTAVIERLSSLPNTFMVSSLTAGGLLSGTPSPKKTAEATGGLLSEIGEFGVLLLKDFTTTLEAPADTRAQLMAALREVYDGEYSRAIGSDGGIRRSWKGKLGVIGAVTDAIDHHSAGWAEMGARFLCFRLEDPQDRTAAARKALRRHGREHDLEVRELTAAHLERSLSEPFAPLSEELEEFVIEMADAGTRLRSSVSRLSTGEVNGEVRMEGPARMAKALSVVLQALCAIGVPEPSAKRIIAKLAVDSAIRSRTVCLARIGGGMTSTAEISKATGISEKVCRSRCDDLRLVELIKVDTSGSKHLYVPTPLGASVIAALL